MQNWIKQGSFAWRQLVEQIERNLWELGDNVHFLKSGWRHSLHSSFRSKHSGHCDCCPSLITHNMRSSVNTRGFCFFLSTQLPFSLGKIGGSTDFNWHWTTLGHWSFCAKGGRSVARSTRKLAESHFIALPLMSFHCFSHFGQMLGQSCWCSHFQSRQLNFFPSVHSPLA